MESGSGSTRRSSVVPGLIAVATCAFVAGVFVLSQPDAVPSPVGIDAAVADVADARVDGTLPAAVAATADTSKPHVLFVLLDDVGYNDMLDQSTDIAAASPNMKAYAASGITLTRYYQEHSCTPGRATILTGKHLWKIGMAHDMIYEDSRWGLRGEYKTIAEHFKDLGYSTHMAGKWDVGHYAKPLWPTSQGFDKFFGMVQQAFNYNSHHCCNVNNTGWGYDLHDGFVNADDPTYYDWYSMNLFGYKITETIQYHGEYSSDPLFLFQSFNGIHAPVYLPIGYNTSDEYNQLMAELDLQWDSRKTFAAVMNIIDDQVESMVEALKEAGYYDNSILVVTSDNGAPNVDFGGVNGASAWPLRGGKTTIFEGGLRVPAFIHSPLIPESQYGTVDRIFHGSDWLPTLVFGAAGGTVDADVDGVNQWPYLMGWTDLPARTELPLNMDYASAAYGGIIVWHNYKYFKLFKEHCYLWYEPTYGDRVLLSGADEDVTAPEDGGYECDDSKYRFYDLSTDPMEKNNLYEVDEYADELAYAKERFCEYYQYDEMVDSEYRGRDSKHMGDAMWNNNDYIFYWQDEESDSTSLKYPLWAHWTESPFCK